VAPCAWGAPNILWLTSEDNGPHLGAYGDAFAETPNLDRLAAGGMRYRHVWSNHPVCAPARTAIITGMYPVSVGAQHMRSLAPMPAGTRMFPALLREAGYYTSNHTKQDYNLEAPGRVWDDSSERAHWRQRAEGQPFFAVFNFTFTHESQIRKRPHTPVHDPAGVRVPAYHPDVPAVRQDWAQYYDKMTAMDAEAGRVLDELRADGLAEETIVFYFGDHGPGLPRCKRLPYDSGLRVPMLVSIPPAYRHLAPPGWAPGGASDRLVGFVDLAPTVLSLAGIEPPSFMQGRAFLGPHRTEDPRYLFGFRDRMDERYDLIRSARDHRFVYIRNYMPHRIYGQHVAYEFETPTTRAWRGLFDQGALQPPRTIFWQEKPYEELYELASDPDETVNLAASEAHRETLAEFRRALDAHLLATRDTGFLPEDELHVRSAGRAPGDMARHEDVYPLVRIKAAAELAASLDASATPRLAEMLADADAAVRYWAALGLLMRGPDAVRAQAPGLQALLADPRPAPRIAAAEALGRYGSEADARRSVDVLVPLADAAAHGAYVAMMALNALDYLDGRAQPARDAVARLPRKDPNASGRYADNVADLIDKILADLE
jgi:uncharacterized sulfatase